MLSKRKISEIRALHQLKIRKIERQFIVEGEKLVKELLESDLKIICLAALPEYLDSLSEFKLPDEIYKVSESELDRISLLSSPNKVLAVAEIPNYPEFDVSSLKGTALILDGIKDPGNLGTIIRTAEWFGVKAVFCSPDCVDCYNPKVVQSSMGSIFRMPVYYEDLVSILTTVKSTGLYSIIGATLHGEHIGSQKGSLKEICLVIGSESHGIGGDIESLLDQKVTIPDSSGNKAESLNAAVACGILLNELKQTKKNPGG